MSLIYIKNIWKMRGEGPTTQQENGEKIWTVHKDSKIVIRQQECKMPLRYYSLICENLTVY